MWETVCLPPRRSETMPKVKALKFASMEKISDILVLLRFMLEGDPDQQNSTGMLVCARRLTRTS